MEGVVNTQYILNYKTFDFFNTNFKKFVQNIIFFGMAWFINQSSIKII